MKEHIDNGQPLVLVFDADIAKLMGNIIERELIPGAGIISIDGIDLKDFDFVDIGQELPDAKAVPVVIKSLIFRHTEHGRGHGTIMMIAVGKGERQYEEPGRGRCRGLRLKSALILKSGTRNSRAETSWAVALTLNFISLVLFYLYFTSA